MCSESDNTEFMIYDNVDEVIKGFFKLLFRWYQIELETSVRRSEFIFHCVHLLYYKCHKINPNQGRSYIDSPDWIKRNNKSHQ